MKKRLMTLMLFGITLFTMSGCTNKANEINILCTTDIHAGITDNISISALSEYRNELKKTSKYVSLVDCGDAIQGDYLGAISKGEDIISVMNKMDYDIMTLGNHEFDYGLDTLSSRIHEFNGDVLSCNIKYTGTNTNKLKEVEPYKIIKYGKTKVAFVGATAPSTLVEASPKTFMEDNKYVYSFSNESKETFYQTIQDNVDICKKKGADVVILLAHLGSTDEFGDFNSIQVAKNITKIDLILDGHIHQKINELIDTRDNKKIPLLEAGTKLNSFGQITIKKVNNGYMLETSLVEKYEAKDNNIDSFVNEIVNRTNELGNKVLATSNLTLKITDEAGIRIVRTRETQIGNMISDAYKYVSDCDIAFVNGGGIRANLNEGDLTFKNIMAIHPFGNSICVLEATGQEILDFLEFTTRDTKSTYALDGAPYGENGSFSSVSGLKYKVNTSIDSSIEIDTNGSFVKVNGPRRVYDVFVYENDNYTPIDVDKTYVIASNDYMLLNGGDGVSMFTDNKVINSGLMLDYEAVVAYIIDVLNGDLKTKYSSTSGRIIID